MGKNFRIRIFQPIVPEYRVALFNGLGERYINRVEVWADIGSKQDRSFPLTSVKYDYAHGFRNIGPIKWQKGLSLKGLKRGDVIVVCGDIHQLSSLWIAIKARCLGIGVVWWGHHKTASSRMCGVWIRLQIAKLLSDVYLCYTETGKNWLQNHGFSKKSVFFTGNTIDQRPINAAMENWDAQSLDSWKKKKGLLDKNLILCCSMLRPKIRLDMAIHAIANSFLAERNTVLAVIGDGPERKSYEQLAVALGVAHRIIWVGATRNQVEMAPWFLSAKIFVYPGSIGLSILHAFSYGLPVVTHSNADHQMPEFEIMEDGKTGAVFDEGNIDDMVAKIVALLDSPTTLSEMSVYTKRIANERYSMDNMIGHYSKAIDSAFNIIKVISD